MRKNNKIVRYPRTLHINIGVIFFALIFIYLIIHVYTYATAKHISYYEVNEGSIRIQTSYTGLALREEQLVYAGDSGYVNYYLKDNSRAKKGSLICSIDETGAVSSQITKVGSNDSALDTAAYQTLMEQMKDYANTYSDLTYYNSYTFKADFQAELMEAVNLGALESMSEYAANAEENNTFHRVKASQPGIVSYYFDSYENVTAENFTVGMFDISKYKKENCKAAEQVEAGEPIFKLITDENWQLVFEISDELKELLADDSAIRVRFKSDETTAWATYEMQERSGNTYLILSFTNSMVRYASERFIDVELLLTQKSGLKIPNGSIVTKTFFAVPKEYFTTNGTSSSLGVLVSTIDDSGASAQKFIATGIYSSTEDNYLIAADGIEKGTKLIHPTGGADYVVSDTEELQGVYNINKGYAVFRIIDIISQNEEYTIIARGTDYGLSQYDHIALDGSLLTENEIVN